MSTIPELAPQEAPESDAAIVAAVRRGRVGEFAVLYERYKDQAMRIARRDAGPDDAPDLVQETFARVLQAIRKGGGPTEDVPGYLFRTLRNLRIDRGGRREAPADDVESLGPPGLWVVDDDADATLDRGLVSEAFKGLPPRWREVLWLTEVEGAGPGELSERMGMRPTAISTLSARARQGFRSAWLQAHLRSDGAPDACRPVIARLGDYETGRLSSRRRAEVQRHLATCTDCPVLLTELTAVSERLGAMLLPLVILAPNAIWWVFGGGVAKAGVLLVGGVQSAGRRLRSPKLVLGAVTGATAVVAVAVAAYAWDPPGSPPDGQVPGATATADATPPSSPDPSGGIATSGSETSPQPAEDAEPTEGPAPEPAPGDRPPAPAPEPGLPEAEQVPGSGTRPAPEPQPQPTPAPGPTQEPDPQEPEPTPGPTPDPEPTPDPTEDPEPELVPPPPPVIELPNQTEVRVAPVLVGTALPGVVVTVTGDDAPAGTAVADEDGAWTLVPESPAQFYTATQEVVDGASEEFVGTSGPSNVVGPFQYTPPQWVGISDGSTRPLADYDDDGDRDDLLISFQGEPGTTIRVLVDGIDVGGTVISDAGAIERYVPDIAAGVHELGVHYVDPDTGARGPAMIVTITAV
ncbi:sigma-70 family RNA polymerase sigma factor [Ruania halotolerans]|uniref:sigma-70 family RNA polymerase sigma factor n=1 Tax=Ruania halotolerans TaxID=2897773 RepID=UPI0025B71C1D|nr:sigma-70 family RNA polymerase sigma factor [Ruania halotolerans]